MSEKPLKRYIFASDFDQTLTFNDSGYVLSEMLGISTDEFERKARGMAKLNLVQQGAEDGDHHGDDDSHDDGHGGRGHVRPAPRLSQPSRGQRTGVVSRRRRCARPMRAGARPRA